MSKLTEQNIEKCIAENQTRLPAHAIVNWKTTDGRKLISKKSKTFFCSSDRHQTDGFYAHKYYKPIA